MRILNHMNIFLNATESIYSTTFCTYKNFPLYMHVPSTISTTVTIFLLSTSTDPFCEGLHQILPIYIYIFGLLMKQELHTIVFVFFNLHSMDFLVAGY